MDPRQLGNPRKDIGEPGLWINVVHLAVSMVLAIMAARVRRGWNS